MSIQIGFDTSKALQEAIGSVNTSSFTLKFLPLQDVIH